MERNGCPQHRGDKRMSLLIFPRNVANLSELEIDVDKDWQGFGISNVKELDAGMHKGDIVVHDGTKLVKVSPTNIGDELTSGGTGQHTTWQAPPSIGE
jgi:hypothetical protein